MSTQMTDRERYWADLMTEEEMDAYESDPANMKPEFVAELQQPHTGPTYTLADVVAERARLRSHSA